MNVIHEEIKAAEQKELAAAIEKHGLHNSLHEKYAVMYEEYDEALDEIAELNRFMESMWAAVRQDRTENANQFASRIEHAALNAAEECIQLAAMARKAVEANV